MSNFPCHRDMLWEISDKDADGNVVQGYVVLHDTRDSYVQSLEGVFLSRVGMEGVIAMATHDAILLAPKDRVQDVKHIVDKLKQAGRAEAELHKRVYRHWGWDEQRGHDGRFQVKLPIPAHPANRSGNIRRFISEYPAN